MNKLLIFFIAVGAVVGLLLLSNLLPAAYYGVSGTPKIVLLTPVCNSSISQSALFTFRPEPNNYHHYRVQIKAGESWDADMFISAIVYETNYRVTLAPGIYMYNVIGYDESDQSRAGSNPCRFVVE